MAESRPLCVTSSWLGRLEPKSRRIPGANPLSVLARMARRIYVRPANPDDREYRERHR